MAEIGGPEPTRHVLVINGRPFLAHELQLDAPVHVAVTTDDGELVGEAYGTVTQVAFPRVKDKDGNEIVERRHTVKVS